MKKIILSIVAIATLSINSFGQAPEVFKYQAVVRNASNTILINQAVSLRMTIKQGSISGTTVYSESFSSTTSANGLVNLEIGNGTPISGTFANIDWANGPFFIETAIDATGGSNYVVMGTSQLMSVPYALYAKTSGSSSPGPIGPQGPMGQVGSQGTTGIGVLSTIDNNNGTFTINYSDGSSFTTSNLTGPTGPTGAAGSVDAWSRIGNATTVDGTNFIGTTDNIPFNIRVNNQKAGRIDISTEGNTFYGYQSGNSNSGSNYNTGIGQQTLYSNTSGRSNTAIGSAALNSNTTGNGSTAIGLSALNRNTTGGYNTAIGIESLKYNTTGGSNTANGSNALNNNTTGSCNTACGVEALYSNITGFSNTAIGLSALKNNSTGSYNIANGRYALYFNTTGDYNTASGASALGSNISGNYNTALGNLAGNSITTGSNNIAIGYNAQVAIATGSDQVAIGNANIIRADVQVPWTTTSDKRWKSDIQPSNLGLEFISKLKPVSYTRNNDESKKREYGFIAQDLEETLNASGAANNGIISKDDAGMYGVRYNDLISPMVKAIQEQQELIKAMNEKMDAMQKQIDKLKSNK